MADSAESAKHDQLVSNLQRGTKALLWIGAGLIIFFGINTSSTFVSAA